MRQAFRRYGKRSQYVPAQQSIGGFGCGLLLRIFDLPAHPATLHFPPRAFAAAAAPPPPPPPPRLDLAMIPRKLMRPLLMALISWTAVIVTLLNWIPS
jgi:hypothetical protein